jgi:4-hydroxy-tetrahydrodipicolinate synthase
MGLKRVSSIGKSQILRGVIPPVTTPYLKNGDVDVPGLERLIKFEMSAGVHAIFALGTGGEGPYQTEDQQHAILSTVTRVVAGKIPVLAGVSDIGTRKVLKNVKIATQYPIDALVSTPAFYGFVGQSETNAHFRSIAEASDLPLYAYDIPIFTGSKINAELTVQLAKDGIIRGIKDTSGEEDGFRYIIEHTRGIDGFAVITGSDITADSAILQGAHGMIVGVANIDPHGFVQLYNHAIKGEWEQARIVQERLHSLRLIAKIAAKRVSGFSATIGAFKEAQVARGLFNNSDLQPPLQSLISEEKIAIRNVLIKQGLGIVEEI